MLDALGREVLTAQLPTGEPQVTLPEHLPPGIYQVRLATAGGLYFVKLLVE